MTEKKKAPQGRKWTVDAHPKKAQIVKALIAGKRSFRNIGEQYGISTTCIHDYLKEKLFPEAAEAIQKRNRDGDYILDQIEEMQAIVREVLDRERNNQNSVMTLAAVREFRAGAEFLAKALGTLKESQGTTVNVTVNQYWTQYKTVILKATEGYPEVRKRIIEGLEHA